MASLWPKDLFLNEQHSDVEVRIEAEFSSKQVIFRAHGLVLKQVSPVFRALLEGDDFKGSKKGVITLSIPGYEVDAVAFFRYIYTRDIYSTDLDNLLSLLQAGHLYQMKSLVENCIKKIKPRLTICSACKIVDLVKCFDQYDIHEHCFTLITRSAFFVFQKNLHLLFSEDSMCAVLSSNSLNVLDEDQVVEAVWNWGKAKVFGENEAVAPKLLKVVDKLLDHVRWTLVENSDKSTLWYEYAETMKKSENLRTALNRKADIKISLLPFSNNCNMYENTKMISNENYPDGQCKIAVFSASQDVLLSGLQLRIATTRWLYRDPIHFHLYLNHVNTKELVYPTFTFLSQNGVKWFCVTFEFYRPLLVEALKLNSLSIEDSGNPPALKMMVRHVLKESYITGPVNFTFYGDIYAVHKLYYFS